MGDTPQDSDGNHVVPPTTTYSVAMTADSPVVPFYEAHRQSIEAVAVEQAIDLEGAPVNIWQLPTPPIEPVQGLVASPP